MDIDVLTQSMENVVTLNGALGSYSLGLHLAIVIIGMTLTMLAVMLIASKRSQKQEVKAACAMDVLIAFGCAFLVLPALAAPFFIGRAFWRAWVTTAR